MEKTKQPKQELKGIVRILGSDMKGERNLYVSLQTIKGVGPSMANAVCKIIKSDRNRKVGSLTDEEIKKIESILSDPLKYGIPSWMFNRRRDPLTGENKHLTGPDVKFTEKQDIKEMIRIKSYKGVRHMLGLPVRGQRTRSSFRKGATVGVVRKKTQPATAKKK
ncbi:MAG: 30S ribosomal protein S13 [Candidatus Aenigmatarchaeota archaeon]